MPVTAEQHFTVDPPGFVWGVEATMAHLLPIVGWDEFSGGHENACSIKAAGLVTVADATGPEIDQGALLRFLGEIVWFPSAALEPYLSWQAVDERSALATMRHGGVTASALFTFDEQGRFVRLGAKRYMSSGTGARLEDWVIPSTAWRAVRGIQMPVAAARPGRWRPETSTTIAGRSWTSSTIVPRSTARPDETELRERRFSARRPPAGSVLQAARDRASSAPPRRRAAWAGRCCRT